LIKRLSDRMATAMGIHLQSSEEEIQVYAYGLEIIFCSLSKIVLFFLISALLGIFEYALLVFLAFAIFRTLGGGVHLKTYARCLTVGLILLLFLTKLASTWNYVNSFVWIALIAVSILAVIAIILWIPAGTEKKTITDPQDIMGQKRKTAVFLVIWLVCTVMLIKIGYPGYATALILGAFGSLFMISPWGYYLLGKLDFYLDKSKQGGEIL
jgi:accessory gene regulator B